MKMIYKNKKATFDYEILEEFKAGIVLAGPEIKSVRAGNVNLKSAYAVIQSGEAFLKNANISRYKYDASKEYDAFRLRKLLLKKSEIDKILRNLNTQGVTVVALGIGLEGKFAKVLIGLARGKKKYDKRQTIKSREEKRQLDRRMKNR